MTRVLQVAQPVDGGVGCYVLDLAVAQSAAGLDVVVACPDGWLAERLDEKGVQRAGWVATRPPGRTVPAETRALAALVERHRPDVVHLHSSKAGLAGRLAIRGRRPTLFQPHGWPWQAVTGAVRAGATSWERLALRWTTAVVCVSEAERDAGLARRVRARYHVVPNGVDLDHFAAAEPNERRAGRAALGIAADVATVVAVGRLDEQKGHETLVRAWPQVLARVPGSILVLVGRGPLESRLRELAGQLGVGGSVVFTGELADVRPAYAAADVVAFSSRWGEAMALTPLEAMASGRPVVASDVAGVRESVAAGCGAIVAPGDAAGFARELSLRLADGALAATEGQAARRRAELSHDIRRAHAYLTGLTTELVRPS